MSVRFFVVASLVVVVGGCAEKAKAPSTAAALVDDCTLETKLVPGVPGSPGNLLASAINPNGVSELAALMRVFVSDLEAARGRLGGSDRQPSIWARHRRIRCAWPTDPRDRNATFDGMAQSYLAAVKAFDATPSAATYDGLVAGCRACHEVTCGGPLQTIEKLRR